MIFGSVIPSAKAITDPTTSKANAQIREIFIEVFLFTKGFLLGNLSQLLGECGEVSSFNGSGQGKSDSLENIYRNANYCARKLLNFLHFSSLNLLHSAHSLARGHREQKKPEPEGSGCPVGCVPG